MDALTVSALEPGGEAEWDEFVERAPGATFFHRAGWKRVIEAAFGHRTYYLAARRGGRICGVLPLTQVKSLLFGNALISNAFCIHGGIVADEPQAGEALRGEAVRIARDRHVKWIEFRSAAPCQKPWESRSGLYFIFRRELAAAAEANLKSLPHGRRRMVRVARDNGLTAEIDADVNRLHHIYADSVRQLGTPVFSRRYFELLMEVFAASCEILTVVHKGQAIASVMSFTFRDEVMTYYGGGLRAARALAGNDFMYWEVMRRAGERGLRIFDFGRSKIGTGAYNFKRMWGIEPSPLAYEYLSLDERPIPEINPLNPKYRSAINVWRRLPLGVTKLIGPAIVRSIG